MTSETAELRKTSQSVLSEGISFPRAKSISKLLKEAKVMAILSLIKKNRG